MLSLFPAMARGRQRLGTIGIINSGAPTRWWESVVWTDIYLQEVCVNLGIEFFKIGIRRNDSSLEHHHGFDDTC
jgi:hypothetical protein